MCILDIVDLYQEQPHLLDPHLGALHFSFVILFLLFAPDVAMIVLS